MNVKAPLSLALLLSLAGCIFDKEANRGSVVDNELRVGKLFLADGSPAVNARVRLYPVDHVPDSTTAVFSTRTDTSGGYALNSLRVGTYNILGDLDGELSFQDSVYIDRDAEDIPADTLDAPGSILGVVELQPGDDPRTVTVQALGTNSFANVDASGRFKLANLGAGKYTIRILTTLPEYTPLFSGLGIRAGREDTLSDTLRPTFTGIPVVTGIKAVLDTVNGVARITWNPVQFASFHSYFVYRDPVGSLEFAKAPINAFRLTDTVFLDTLYRASGDTLPRNWEYRVNVKNLNGKPGKVFHAGVLAAVPPRTAQTRFRFSLMGTHGDTASIRDTIQVIADFENPTYANMRLAWTEAGQADTLRTAMPDAKAGTDTLTWTAPESAGERTIRIVAWDAAGRSWRDSLRVRTVLDRPKADAGRDSIIGIGTEFTLRGKGSDGFGSIVKWEWRIGGSDGFAQTGSGDTTFILPGIPDSAFLCVLRITDDDGFTALDTVKLDIRRSRVVGRLATPQAENANLIVASFPRDGKIITVLDSMGQITIESFDPLSGKSAIVARNRLEGVYRTAAVAGSKVYLAGSYSQSFTPLPGGSMSAYDFESGAWENAATAAPYPSVDFEMIGFGGRIYAFEEKGNIFEYDPSAKKWTVKRNADPKLYGATLCVGDGRIYALNTEVFGAYDPVANTWQPLSLPMSRFRPGLGWADGKLYVLGGGLKTDYAGGVTNAVEEYDPALDSWASKGSLIHHTGHPGVAVLGDRIYVVGSSALPEWQVDVDVLDFIEAYRP